MATAAYLDQFRAPHASGGALANMLLMQVWRVDGSQVDTLSLADPGFTPAEGAVAHGGVGLGVFHWRDGVVNEWGPVRMPGTFCGTSVELCTTYVVLNAGAQMRLPDAGGGVLDITLRDMLRLHAMTQATVYLYRGWTKLAGLGDVQNLGSYSVVAMTLEGADLRLDLRQSTTWNVPVVPRYVNRQDYPRAPDSAVGVGLPVVLGNVSGLPTRRPWPDQYGAGYHALEHLRGGRRVGAAVLVDNGRGSASAVNPDARVLVAGHQCKTVIDDTQGCMVFAEREGKLCMLDDPAYVVNTATEAGMRLPDNFGFAWIGLPPSEVLAPANSAYNARHAIEPSDSTYALLDYAAGYRELRVRLPSPVGPGELVAWQAVLGLQTSSDFYGCGFFISNDAMTMGTDLWPPRIPVRTTLTAIGSNLYTGGWGAWPTPDSPWQFGTDRLLRVVYDPMWGAGAGWARIYFIGIIAQFRPREELLQTERFTGRYNTVQRVSRYRVRAGKPEPVYKPYQEPVMEPAVTELQGRFFANVKGVADTGTGTYTGTANALIERAPDLMRYVLTQYGGRVVTDFEITPGVVGSLTDARSTLVGPGGRALPYAMSLTKEQDVNTVLGALCTSALAMPMLSPYSDRWGLVPWRPGAPVTYPWTFTRTNVLDELGPRVEPSAVPDVVTGVRVSYGYNAHKGTYDCETAVSSGRSVAGYEYFGLRDQMLTVTAGVNDRLDFKQTYTGATLYTMQLTAGTYASTHLLAKHLTARMRVAAPNDHLWSVCNVIEEGYNDKLVVVETSEKWVAIKPGTYSTLEALAAAAERALNQSSTATCRTVSGDPVVYDVPAEKVKVAAPGMLVTGSGIPAGTYVVSAFSTTALQLSKAATAAASGVAITLSVVCSYSSGASYVTVLDARLMPYLTRGMKVAGTGIQANTIVTSVLDGDQQLQLSLPTTLAGDGVGLTVGNATVGGWQVRYTSSTGKFGAYASTSRSIKGKVTSVHHGRNDSAWGVLGFSRMWTDIALTGGVWRDADDVRYADHLCLIGQESTTDLLFQSGTNGQDSAVAVRHCGELVGALGATDETQSRYAWHGMTCFYCPKPAADYPAGGLEAMLANTAALYGARRDVQVEAKAILDTVAAMSLRDRLARLQGIGRNTITFDTLVAPNIERGDVFAFDSSMDGWVSYPLEGGDGTWSSRRFVVTDVVHQMSPQARGRTTITAVDITD